MKDETLKNAFQGWDVLSATQEEVLAYEARQKQVLDEEAARVESELREKEALEKGLTKGREKGREEGRKEERKKMIKKMLQQGLELEQIALIAESSVEEVKKIKDEQ